MKLYTEEQVRLLLDLAKLKINGEMYSKNVLLQQVTPIQLPSDEEIEEKAEFLFPTVNIMSGSTYIAHKSFIEGAKWMREQIKNKDL